MMDLVKKFSLNVSGNEGYRMGLVRSTSFGRKRVALSNVVLEVDGNDGDDCVLTTPTNRQCFKYSFLCSDKSDLEALPQDILIRIVCGVEHEDLKRLFFVSISMREVALTAKQWHFAYKTPRKTVGFRDLEDLGEFDEVEPPNAPKQSRVPRSRLCAKKLADISVALFDSDSKENWPRRDLFVAMETEI